MTVKEAICQLCKVFKLAGNVSSTPEDFRLAKIDSPKSIPVMCRLVAVLLTHIDPTFKLDSAKSLKSALLKLRYKRVGMMFSDESAKMTSSREALFCLAYYLSATRYLAVVLTAQALAPIDPTPASSLRCHDDEYDDHHHEREEESSVAGVCELMNQVRQLHNKLLSLDRHLFVNRLKLSERVSDVTPSLTSLSREHQVLVVKHPELQRKVCSELKRRCQLMRCYLKWRGGEEKSFWSWLRSAASSSSHRTTQAEHQVARHVTDEASCERPIRELHSNLTLLVGEVKEKRKLESGGWDQQTKKLELHEKMAIEKEVEASFRNVKRFNTMPKFVKDGSGESSSSHHYQHHQVEEVEGKLDEMLRRLQASRDKFLESNRRRLNNILATSAIGGRIEQIVTPSLVAGAVSKDGV